MPCNQSGRLFMTGLCLMLVLPLPALAQQNALGRFFSTPAERAALDEEREILLRQMQLDELSSRQLDLSDDDYVAPPPDLEVYLSGTLRRANGQHTIWLNGAAIDEQDLPLGYSLVNVGPLTALRIEGDQTVFTLRPGQVLRLQDGTISESPFPARTARPVTDNRARGDTATAPDRQANPDNTNSPQDIVLPEGISELVPGADNVLNVLNVLNTLQENL